MDDAGLGRGLSAFTEVAGLPPQRIWAGALGRAVHGERVTLSVVELDPNVVIPEHRHENEQVGVIVSGSLTFRVGDETRELVPGGAWCIGANVPHEVRTGDGGAVVIEVFAPRRDDWHTLEHEKPRRPRWPEET
jgi:quercetin dioxygenase-like cupin family protein